jgi:hypothetical protein
MNAGNVPNADAICIRPGCGQPAIFTLNDESLCRMHVVEQIGQAHEQLGRGGETAERIAAHFLREMSGAAPVAAVPALASWMRRLGDQSDAWRNAVWACYCASALLLEQWRNKPNATLSAMLAACRETTATKNDAVVTGMMWGLAIAAAAYGLDKQSLQEESKP